jgi:secreted trypsin-like serine protease
VPLAWLLAALALVLLALAPARAAAAERPLLVHGGTDAPVGDWGWIVALVDPDEPVPADGQFCGGTLIAPTVVVTAAHCLVNGKTERPIQVASVEVVSGAVDLGIADVEAAGGQRIAVTEIRMHPRWNPARLGHDLAVLVLAEPARATPARILRDSERARTRPGRRGYIAGWGLTTSPRYATRLQVADVPFQPDWMCAFLAADQWDGGAMSCAGGFASAYSCSGDSGGPLMVRDATGQPILAGIVSFGGIFCEGGYGLPTAFTDLAAYDDWLAQWLPPEAQDAASPEPPDDVQAPRVRAVAARGAFGKRIALRFTVADDSGTARVAVTVRAPGVVLRRMYSGGFVPAAAAFPLTADWQAPGAARKGLHFCVEAVDRAGNRAARSCAPIRLAVDGPSLDDRT